jgi:hypothetical protein
MPCRKGANHFEIVKAEKRYVCSQVTSYFKMDEEGGGGEGELKAQVCYSDRLLSILLHF